MTLTIHHILVVEDDPNQVMLLDRAFRKTGLNWPWTSVGDGDAAVEYLSGTGAYADRSQYPMPSLLLLDIKLPRRSGLEVLAWLRQSSHLKRLPVVMLTSSRESVDVNQAYDLGANSYLTKPARFDELLNMMRTLNLYWLQMNEQPSVEEL
jgi:DNA-binding response OmpR family regulator